MTSNSLIGQIRFIEQPSPYTCGQACVAMLTGESVEQVCARLGRDGRTSGAEIRRLLGEHPRVKLGEPHPIEHAPGFIPLGVVFLSYPSYGHWALWVGDAYLDPARGELEPSTAWESWRHDGIHPFHILPVEIVDVEAAR